MHRMISVGGVATGAAAVALLAFHAPTAHAVADQYQVSRVTVRFADLDPTSPEDTTALYSRLRSAAREVCEIDDVRADFAERVDRMTCERDAIDTAVAQIDSPSLSALHDNARPAP
jgi:UrcA family protein